MRNINYELMIINYCFGSYFTTGSGEVNTGVSGMGSRRSRNDPGINPGEVPRQVQEALILDLNLESVLHIFNT
jgi:hypothetical protein